MSLSFLTSHNGLKLQACLVNSRYFLKVRMLEIQFRSLWLHIDSKHRVVGGGGAGEEKLCNLMNAKEQRIPLGGQQGLELKGHQEEQFP